MDAKSRSANGSSRSWKRSRAKGGIVPLLEIKAGNYKKDSPPQRKLSSEGANPFYNGI